MKNNFQVQLAYDQIGQDFSSTRPHLSPEVISLIPKLEPKASVLDLGCGNGVLLTALQNIDYLGLDFSQTLIDEAQKLHPQNRFQLADITNPAVWQDLGEYDFIAAIAVFHHLPDTKSHVNLLRQIKDHLKLNGQVLISVWDLNQPKFSSYSIGPKLYSIPFHSGPKRFFYAFAEDELPDLAQKSGFRITKKVKIKDNLFFQLEVL